MELVENIIKNVNIRSYNSLVDQSRVEEIEQLCGVGTADKASLFTNTLGDPLCRIRNSPLYTMLVAELSSTNELVGVIQGSIKMVTLCSQIKDRAMVGYILGLRVSPQYRRRGIATTLVRSLENWFLENKVDFAYMATERENKASVNLFKEKTGFIDFRTLSMLINPVSNHSLRVPNDIEIKHINVEIALELYKRAIMGSTEFFPHDMDAILKNKLSLGTWVAYFKGDDDDHHDDWESNGHDHPRSWAIVSLWNSGQLFKLRVGDVPTSCLMSSMVLRFLDRALPFLKIQAIPDLSEDFGFYFMYGVHGEGVNSGMLVSALCRFAHNMAMEDEECKLVVTEIGGRNKGLQAHIPHSRFLSCNEDLWCIKALKNEHQDLISDLKIRVSPSVALFVDPREV